MINPLVRPSTLGVPAAEVQREDYPVAFWSLVLFTFVVFVAPQNSISALRPLYLGKTSAILAILAYVGQRISRNASILPIGPEFRLLGFFVFLAVLSIPFSFWPGGSFKILSDSFIKSVAVCVITAQVVTSRERLKQMLWAVVLFGFTITLLALFGYRSGAALVEGYRMSGGPSGISGNPNDFALTINIIIPFAVAFFMMSQSSFKKALIGTFLGAGVLGILLTYSRAGFVTLAGVVFLALIKGTGGSKKLNLIFPILLILVVVVILAPQGYGDRVLSIFDSSKDKAGSSTIRMSSMTNSLALLAENPLLGVGMGMNILAMNEKGMFWMHVHNIYLQIATELGIPALIVFLVLVRRLMVELRLIQTRFKGSVEHSELYLLAVACEISLLAFCLGAMFYPVAYYFYFYYVAGFALALKGIAARVSHQTEQSSRLVRPWEQRNQQLPWHIRSRGH